ncbi:cysteine desulfurase family protein [Alpinimonas psychrophila]|uniref:cysteine desulfurase n=1 Tax=Alpinimonas psychrophila TaxID=748908 RepID=A0A7W3PMS2_9MICO|nr:cysteine desulfurase family protein [Alpinimonas psychrophila]MBA8828154.1 cysteine desulfurase [Alpinimonas psychrophila]
MIYLDNAATTPVRPEALQAAWPWLTSEFGNPSSTHELGHRASGALSNARATVATWLDCRPSEVVFTSGGTEGDNIAILGLALANPRGRHIVSAHTEHEAVLASIDALVRLHNFEVSWLPVSSSGEVTLADVNAALRPGTTLVTLMLANNEIGTIHPIAAIAELAHAVGALMHTDVVQAAGWLDVRVTTLGVDALTLSGHKLGAPKGSGAVYLRGRLAVEPLLHGGGQEFDRRSGTENVAWAVALATAISLLDDPAQEGPRVAQLRDIFITSVQSAIDRAQLTGPQLTRHPAIASFTFAGLNGETLLLELEERNVIVSSGSACAAGKTDPSHVLLAVGIDPEVAQTSVRFSFSHETTAEELTRAVAALTEAVASVTALAG